MTDFRGPTREEVDVCHDHHFPNYCDCFVHALMIAAAMKGINIGMMSDPDFFSVSSSAKEIREVAEQITYTLLNDPDLNVT